MNLACAFGAALAFLRCGDFTVTVDPAVEHQVIAGWEASAGIDWPEGYTPERIDELFRRSIDEVGINRMRVSVFAGAEDRDRSFQRWQSGEVSGKAFRKIRYTTLNDNDDPFLIDWDGFDFANLDWRIENMVLPMRRLLAERGERLFVNLNYVAFTDQSVSNGVRGRYDHADPEEYAEFVLATYQHMDRSYGFVPDAWEVILEPDLVPEWRRDPALIGRAMVAAAARLRAAGYAPRFIVPAVTDMAHAVPYLRAILGVPGARELIHEVSYHRYRGNEADLRRIAAAAAEIDVPPAMLEWWFGLATSSVLFEDLTTGNNGAWAGRALQGLMKLEDGRFRMQGETRFTSLYTAFVRAGATRIEARATYGKAEALAFRNPDGTLTVTTRTGDAGVVRLEGLAPGDYRLFWATEEACATSLARAVDASGAIDVEMPAAGVLALTSLMPSAPGGDRFLTDAVSSRCTGKD